MSNETLWFENALLSEGWAANVRIGIASGRIVSITPGVAPSRSDERHKIGLSGLPNLHSHAFQRLMAGLAEYRGNSADSFWTWRTLMYAQVAKLTPDDVEAVAALAYMEMLEAGFTRVGEFHYLHHDPNGDRYADPAEMAGRIVQAAQIAGIGLTLLPVFYAHSGFGGLPANPSQTRFLTTIDGFNSLLQSARKHAAHLEDAVVGLAPHSLRAVTEDELKHLVPLAGGAPLHIHISEQMKEVDDCLAWSGQRPVAWLLDRFDISAQWCLVHATHVDASELKALAASGAVVGLCPITEANLGDGLFPARDYVNLGGAFGIGSDSNVLIDAAEELRLLEYGQRLALQQRNILALKSCGSTLVAGAVTGGGQALGVTCGLETGNSADIIGLDSSHPSLLGRSGHQWLDSFVFSGASRAIDCVWRYGHKQVISGRHKDRDRIVRAFARVVEKLNT